MSIQIMKGVIQMNGIDIIIGLIIVVLIAYGAYKMYLQLSGKKTCCGGSKEIVKSNKVNNTIGSKTVHIKGMHCDHCKNTVIKTFNEIQGVSTVVDLEKKIAVISFEHEISNELIQQMISKKGFEVTQID